MFNNINVNNYDFHFELHYCGFLIDCLFPEVQFGLEDDEIVIKLNGRIIDIDELIYFINFNVAHLIYSVVGTNCVKNSYCYFRYFFNTSDKIRHFVNITKIYLKYVPTI